MKEFQSLSNIVLRKKLDREPGFFCETGGVTTGELERGLFERHSSLLSLS